MSINTSSSQSINQNSITNTPPRPQAAIQVPSTPIKKSKQPNSDFEEDMISKRPCISSSRRLDMNRQFADACQMQPSPMDVPISQESNEDQLIKYWSERLAENPKNIEAIIWFVSNQSYPLQLEPTAHCPSAISEDIVHTFPQEIIDAIKSRNAMNIHDCMNRWVSILGSSNNIVTICFAASEQCMKALLNGGRTDYIVATYIPQILDILFKAEVINFKQFAELNGTHFIPFIQSEIDVEDRDYNKMLSFLRIACILYSPKPCALP
jgi:hypothetical protein